MRLILIAALVLGGCAMHRPPTATYDFDPTAAYPGASFDEVWDAVIDVFGEQTWPIDQIEKASGVITTGWLRAPRDWADCGTVPGIEATGSLPADRIQNQEVRFNVIVRRRDGVTTMRVNTAHRAIALEHNRRRPVECISKGTTEKLLGDLVREALGG